MNDFREIQQDECGEIVYKTTPYRWLILAVFCGILLNNCIAPVGFNAIANNLQVAFGISEWPVMLLLITPSLVYAPASYISVVCFGHWKIDN